VARREVLDRLLLLNYQRHEAEVQAGLIGEHGMKGSKGIKAKRGNSDSKKQGGNVDSDLQAALFSD
jgi:hypothetical protein